MIKVSNIKYNDTPINIIGLNELLSEHTLWQKKSSEETDYTRKVVKHDGKTRTLLKCRSCNESEVI